jgi:hypothetical protein
MRAFYVLTTVFFISTTLFGQPNSNVVGHLNNWKSIYKLNGKFGILNYSGKVDYLYDSICKPAESKNYFFALKNKKWGVVDLENKVIIPFEYEKIEQDFNHSIRETTGFVAQKNGNLGVIDSLNRIIIPFEYDAFSGWCDELPCNNYAVKNKKFGIIDNNGKIIIPFKYDSIYLYTENQIKVKYNEKFGVVNIKNEIIVPLEYDVLIFDYSYGDWKKNDTDKFVVRKDRTWSYLDLKGQLIKENVSVETIMEEYKPYRLNNYDFEYVGHCMIYKE